MPYRHREKIISIFFCLGVDLISLKIYKFGWLACGWLACGWLACGWLACGWLACGWLVGLFASLVKKVCILFLTLSFIVFLCDKVSVVSFFYHCIFYIFNMFFNLVVRFIKFFRIIPFYRTHTIFISKGNGVITKEIDIL